MQLSAIALTGLVLLACAARVTLGGAWAASPPTAQPRTWLPAPRALSPAITDADPHTYEILCQASRRDNFDTHRGLIPTEPCDVGLEWSAPQTLGALVVDYATLAGVAYEPARAGQTLQAFLDGGWRDLPAALAIDRGAAGAFAPLQGSGTSRWTYRFPPVRTARLRLLLSQPRNGEIWHRLYAIRSLRATAPGLGAPSTGAAPQAPGPSSIEPDPPDWLDGDLALAGAQSQTGAGAEVRWPRTMLFNRVEIAQRSAVPPADSSQRSNVLEAEWWDGARWRAVEGAEPLPRGVRFLPVAAERLRLRAQAPAGLKVFLDAEAARYFREIEQSRTDALGSRFRAGARPDLLAMRGLLLPLDFARAAIGRPADTEETHVAWNGSFWMVEHASGGLWVLSESRPDAALPLRHDRWFALAAGEPPVLFGAGPTDGLWTRTRYAEGWLPATITTHSRGGVEFEERLFVTAPGAPLYGTVLEVQAHNASARDTRTALTLVLGRRRNLRFERERRSPLSYDPEPTGYSLSADRRAVRSATGEIIAWAETPGRWEGTPRENHLRYRWTLKAGERAVLRFFLPHVSAPLRQPPPALAPAQGGATPFFGAAWTRFRAYWAQLQGGMTVEVPEPEINDIYKSLLAQALIITRDGDEVKYGAYAYEMFFGAEEAGPAVALAQYGHGAAAQELLSLMMAPRLRHDCEHPSFVAEVYRLTRDRRWLASLGPALAQAAQAIQKALHHDLQDQDARHAGLLPRGTYGGDVDTPAYSLTQNMVCWRSLHETAGLLRALDPAGPAATYQREADEHRGRVLRLVDELVDRRSDPPFLPGAFEIGAAPNLRAREPAHAFLGNNVSPAHFWAFVGNYWNLTASAASEVRFFAQGDPRAAWIPDYMEARGGVLAGLVRFTLGTDAIYGKGYADSLLQRGQRDRFWTALCGLLAHGMAPGVYSFPEVAGVFPLRVSNGALYRERQRALWSWGFQGWEQSEGEPLSAGPGVALRLLRSALLREETDPAETLRLLDGAPRSWFAPGQRVVVRDAPTSFGGVSFETQASEAGVSARVRLAPGCAARRLILRLADPRGRPLRRVLVDGRPWSDFSAEEVRLPARAQQEVWASAD